MRVYWLAVLASVSAFDARAQGAPVVAPTRDVTVSYQLTGVSQTNGAVLMKIAYAHHNDQVRMDFYAFAGAQVPFGSVIWDAPANHVWSLLPETQSYYELPAAGKPNPGLLLNDKMTFSRIGDTTVAGLGCTDWTIGNGADYAGSVCVTADGVVLRALRTKPQEGSMLATAVVYGAPLPDTFKVPADLKLRPSK